MTSFDLLTLNLTFKVKRHFGNRVILKAWPIVILSGMVASFEQKKMPYRPWPADYTWIKIIPIDLLITVLRLMPDERRSRGIVGSTVLPRSE